ncbi:MAG: heparan-alpha-glucosaminide N-acetyltransferase domain-containing protein [Ginsengibacter sp.]
MLLQIKSKMQNASTDSLQTGYRIQSIDLLRGLVMIIMALDHTRDYFHWSAMLFDPLDLEKTSIPIFLTRWITHYCAPVFVFLAGTSAFFIGVRKGKKELSAFLLKRGLWLIVLEITVISFGWFFNIHFTLIVLQTIWALGFGMIALSALIHLPKRLILITAIAIIFGHNLLDLVHVAGQNAPALGWSLLHDPNGFVFSSLTLIVGYPVLSWIGVMAAGYCLGELYVRYSHEKRKKILLYLGLSAIFIFILLRFINIYGDSKPWSAQHTSAFTFFSFVNTTKYPPSLLYILMTLGPALIFLALAEKPLNRFTRIITVYGRVPLFYYVLHIYFIHLLAMLAAQLTGYNWSNMILHSFPGNIPSLRHYGFHLWFVYVVWIIIVVALYPLCKWYNKYKIVHKEKWWLSYL